MSPYHINILARRAWSGLEYVKPLVSPLPYGEEALSGEQLRPSSYARNLKLPII